MDVLSQGELILNHLKTGRPLTPLEALEKFGCFRLGARIWDLKREGYDIQTDLVDVGNGKRVASYQMKTPGGGVPTGRLGAHEAVNA